MSVRLNSVREVNRLLKKVINELMEPEGLDTARARAVIYGCSILLKGIETADLEERINVLEQGARKWA